MMNQEERIKIKNNVSFLILKRGIDLFGSIVGLVLLSPLFLIIFILMQLEEKGAPFIYCQKRVGKDGIEFKMYKIRSMCLGADKQLADLLEFNEIEGAMFKMKEDPRVTKVGKFIRKTSIDEFPQLLNVLKGEMSLVGPRPPLPREVLDYSNYDMQRLLVIPGCTGPWQISGRNDVGFKEMVELDLGYIENQSIKNDILILINTIYVILKPNSAY
ncbi:sugar transferase [Vagococcus sp.]|uniref:sugar transferase n=1 Tax=Vagococcus sp. TaxID=1933889 RepID=UPI003F9B25BC